MKFRALASETICTFNRQWLSKALNFVQKLGRELTFCGALEDTSTRHAARLKSFKVTEISELVLFPVALTASGDKALTDGGTRIDAVKAEAVAICEDKQWASLINMMALASVIERSVYSLYPEVNFRFRPFHPTNLCTFCGQGRVI